MDIAVHEDMKVYSYKASQEDMDALRALPVERLPKIACVVPSYNQGAFLPATLESILAQDYPALEIFVADGGSTDNSLEVLREYAARYPDTFRYDSAPDGGQAGGVNKAIAATSGEIIAWINSDDLYLPGAFWKIAAFFYYNRCAFVVFGDSYFVDENEKHIGDYPVRWSPIPAEFQRKMKHGCVIPQPSLFFRREAIALGGGLCPGRALDYELWMRWLQKMPFYYYNDLLSKAVVHGEAISANADKKMLISTCRLVHRYYNVVPLNWCMIVAHNHAYGAAWAKGEHPPYTFAVKRHGVWLFFILNLKWLPWTVWRKCKYIRREVRDNLWGNV